jgi:lysozyme
MLRRFLPLLAALMAVVLVAGCGSSVSTPRRLTVTKTVTAHVPYLPPETARVPDGARSAPTLYGAKPGAHPTHIDKRGLLLIESFEGYRRCAYWDPYGHVWTAGFGQTQGIYAGFCFADRAAAEANLKRSVEATYEPYIRALGVRFNQNQWDALCSFAYNLGAGIFGGTSVGADLRARNFGAATHVMLQYVYAGGVVLPGLVARRREEVALFDTPVRHVISKATRRKINALRVDRGRNEVRGRRQHCGHLRGRGDTRVARQRCSIERARVTQISRQIKRLER